MLLGAAFAARISRPLKLVAQMAQRLTQGEKLAAAPRAYKEADAVVSALRGSASQLETMRTRERLIVSESTHRVKNILAVVQSLVQRTLSAGHPLQDAQEILQQRLQALARAQEMLMTTDWRGGALEDIVKGELTAYRERIHIEGPHVTISSSLVQTFSLLVHELATNAVKYGALANEAGKVSVAWQIDHTVEPAHFKFRWQETDGPPVEPPTRKGFGSALLEGAIPASTTRLVFDAGGLMFELDAPLAKIVPS
jgi:two-component sensor histidine kinase